MPSVKVFVPKSLVADPQKLTRAVANALDGAAKGAKVDFETTTATWQHTVNFTVDAPSADRRVVGTDDDIYHFVSGGTKAHPIVAHGKALVFFGEGFRPKTRPHYIGSNKGSMGNGVVFRKRIPRHPGNKPREFDEAIAEKWKTQLAVIMQRAVDSEL